MDKILTDNDYDKSYQFFYIKYLKKKNVTYKTLSDAKRSIPYYCLIV